METRAIIYVAAPLRAETADEVEGNVQRAAMAAGLLTARGWAVCCPHTNSHLPSQLVKLPEDDWLESGLALLRRADAVVLLEGWQNSLGCLSERSWASMEQKPIFHGLDAVPHAADFWNWCRDKELATTEERRR